MNTPLENLTVLNTRPIQQAQTLNQTLNTLGAHVIDCPALEIAPVKTHWEATLTPLSSFEMIIFISVNAVRYFFERISPKTWPNSLTTIAMGMSTAQSLLEKKIIALQPKNSTTEGLLHIPALQQIKKKQILIVKGVGGRKLLHTTLLNKGAAVQLLDVYTRNQPQISDHFIKKIWQDNLIDIILFTSQQALEQLFALFGQPAQDWLEFKPCLVISQRLADVAQQMGIKKIFITAPNQIPEGLIRAYHTLKLEKQGVHHD